MKNLYFEVNGSEICCVSRKITDDVSPAENLDTKVWFRFSKEWDDLTKVIKLTRGGIEFEPQVINDENFCYIPEDAVKSGWFRLKVIGAMRVDDGESHIETDTIIVYI